MAAAKSMPPVPCPACKTPLVAGLPLCARCGEVVPDHAAAPRGLVLKSGPGSLERRRRAEQLLAHAGEGLDEAEVRRRLGRLPAAFQLPTSDAVTARLLDDLGACGYEAEVWDGLPPQTGLREYGEWLLASPARLLPFGAAAGAFVVAATTGHAWMASAALLAGWLWGWMDLRRYLRSITLRPGLLARRLDIVPEETAQPVGALLRGTISEPLRQALGAALTEHAHLLGAVHGLATRYPDLVGPLREGVAEATGQAARLGEKVAAIERAGDLADPEREGRLAKLREAGGEEIERRLLDMDIAGELREGRAERLTQIHATLLVRLEAITDALRSLRQRAIETQVADAARAAPAIDEILSDLRRELDVAAAAVGEMDELDRALAIGRSATGPK